MGGVRMTVVERPSRWGLGTDGDDVPSALVARVHSAVGEALTQRHSADDQAGRQRLTGEDERALARKLIGDEVKHLAGEALREGRQPLSDDEEEALTAAVLHRLGGMARIQPLLDDPEIRDIHIPGADPTWLLLRDGRKVRGPAVADSA